MYVTIALNAYANGRRAQSWRWLGRALAAWPPQLFDPRFSGALLRACVGPDVLRKLSVRRNVAGA
jgi:hypothetical protein